MTPAPACALAPKALLSVVWPLCLICESGMSQKAMHSSVMWVS